MTELIIDIIEYNEKLINGICGVKKIIETLKVCEKIKEKYKNSALDFKEYVSILHSK